MIAYESEVEGGESHLALVKGDVGLADDPTLVRVHSHCLAGDIFGTTACDCHAIVQSSSATNSSRRAKGALVYLA